MLINDYIDVSIVLFNSLKWLDKFFDSLERQEFPLSKIRLLVRNNLINSNDSEWIDAYVSKKKHLYAEIVFESGKNIGFGQGHNSNLLKAKSNFFLVTNVDLEFESNTLVTLVEAALADREQVAQWECRQKPYEHPKHYQPQTGYTLWCSSACTLFRTSALQDVRGYEPKLFMYGEDVELSYRLRDRGYILRYVPKAAVWHYSYQEAGEIKPLQFFGSIYANVLLRCRYGRWHEILAGFVLYFGAIFMPQYFPSQRWGLIKNFFSIVAATPYFLLTRRKSNNSFPFRLWDYEMAREGAFFPQKNTNKEEKLPLVSVLVRTTPGKTERLKETVASVLAQTYPFIQLVVVEDGGDSAKQFVEVIQDEKIISFIDYFPLEKIGRCGAGNKALELSKGDLVCFLDDDDLFYADHLETLVNSWLQDKTLGAVYGLSYQIKTDIIDPLAWKYKELEFSVVYRQPFNRYLMWHHNYLPIQTVLFKRALYENYGGFDPELDNLEDWNLWVRYSLKHDFKLVPKVTSLYRVPANTEVALERQEILDSYYAKAQAKHALLEVNLSPVEVLNAAEQLSRELYVTVLPTKSLRRILFSLPGVRFLYYPLRKIVNKIRLIRARKG